MLTATFRLLSRATALAGFERMAIEEHGASGWPSFAEKAKKLIDQDQVPMVLGGWTSVSRKATLPVLEARNAPQPSAPAIPPPINKRNPPLTGC